MFHTTHFLLGAIGLVALLRTALQLWGMEIPVVSIDYGTYKHIWLNRVKVLDLLLHVGGVCVLVLYFAMVRRYFQQVMPCDKEGYWWKISWLLVVAVFTATLIYWRPEQPYEIAEWAIFTGLAVLWAIITYAPVYGPQLQKRCQRIDWQSQWNPANSNRVYILLTVVAVGQLIWTLAPFVLQRVQLLNEYLEVPTVTRLFESNQDVVDTSYYDAHQLLGPVLRYSPDRDRGNSPQIAETVCIDMDPAPGLASFLAEDSNRNGFVYDKAQKRLCAVDKVSPEQWLRLRTLIPDEVGRRSIDAWYASVCEYSRKLQEKVLSLEEKQFFRVNRFSFGFQFAGNGVIHHHGFMLNPLNEFDLGKPRTEIFAQYGWLNLWMTRSLMHLFGGMDYQTYFKVWYSYYYLYYLLYFGLLWLVFRHKGYLAAGSLLSVGLLCFIEFQWLLQPPGINPIRRIMELPLMAGLFLYWQTERRRYLVAAMVAVFLAILNNWQFGLMALDAAGLTLALFQWGRCNGRGKIDKGIMISGLIVSLVMIAWMRGTPDPLSVYYLAGSAAMPIGPWLGLGVLIAFSLGASLLLRTFEPKQPLSFLYGFVLLYTAEVMTYSLWNGSPTYLLVPAPLYVLLLLTIVRHCAQNSTPLRNRGNVVVGLVVGISLVMFIVGSWKYESTHTEFLGLMDSHKTYEWNLDRAKFVSTMDPRYFEDGVALIQKYSTKPGIYIVSKYDNFLPFLSSRFSAMPYFEVSKFLVSPRETEACVQRLLAEKPEILFVDTDIRRNFATDIVHQQAPLSSAHGISRYHVEQMRTLQKVFLAVQDDYELLEQGLLISVYRRK